MSTEAMKLHESVKGKLEIKSRVELHDREDLALAYTPGVAEPCLAIKEDPERSYDLTRRWNTVAVVTDGTAVLGLGDIGPEAGMPVMEGKCILFKEFGGVDAIPLCVRSKNVDEIVNAVALLAGSFGGINLEDISAPRCFEIERKLKKRCDIPVFHDDQHGTAVVVLAAVKNAWKLGKKDMDNIKVVISGSGAAGVSITRLLLRAGVKDVTMTNSRGVIYEGKDGLNDELAEMAKITNRSMCKGDLKEALVGADVFIGVSAANIVTREMVMNMGAAPIVFAMANPVPEIMPDEARAGGATIIGTGRSDFANQINNLLAFPGIFRGALDVRASDINDDMKLAAAFALADLISEDELTPEYVIPSVFDKRVCTTVSQAVSEAAKRSGVARA